MAERQEFHLNVEFVGGGKHLRNVSACWYPSITAAFSKNEKESLQTQNPWWCFVCPPFINDLTEEQSKAVYERHMVWLLRFPQSHQVHLDIPVLIAPQLQGHAWLGHVTASLEMHGFVSVKGGRRRPWCISLRTGCIRDPAGKMSRGHALHVKLEFNHLGWCKTKRMNLRDNFLIKLMYLFFQILIIRA